MMNTLNNNKKRKKPNSVHGTLQKTHMAPSTSHSVLEGGESGEANLDLKTHQGQNKQIDVYTQP